MDRGSQKLVARNLTGGPPPQLATAALDPLPIRQPRQAANAPRENTQLLAGMAASPTPGGTGGVGGASQLAAGAVAAPKVQYRGGSGATGTRPAARPAATPVATGNGPSRPAASARGAAATAAAVPAAGAASQLAAGAMPSTTRQIAGRGGGSQLAGGAVGSNSSGEPTWFESAQRSFLRSLPAIGPLTDFPEMARSAARQPAPTNAAELGRGLRNAVLDARERKASDSARTRRPFIDFAAGLTGLEDEPPAAAAPTPVDAPTNPSTDQPAGQLAAGAVTSVPGIVRFDGADGVPIYTNRPTEVAVELAGNDGRLRYGVTSVPTVVPAPGVAMSEATSVTPTTGQRTRPADGFTAADRLTQLAGMAMRSNNYAAGQAADRNAGLIRDARSAAQAGRTGEATQLAQLAQIAGQQAPRAGAVGLPPGLTLGAIDRDARFADRARVAAELRGTQLANEGTALANRGAALTQQQTEQQAALMQDLLSGDEARRNTAAEKLARLNALAAKPEAPITASVAGEHGADQYVVDPRTGRTIFDPAKARAVAQSRNAISAALADGDERLAQELADQLARAHGIRIDIGAAAE